jgi:transposase
MRAINTFNQIYLHFDPVDMRKGINGLLQVIHAEQMGDITGPSLFVFTGRRKNTIKVLYFDGTGFCLWIKQLEKARFSWPRNATDPLVLSAEQFQWLLEGYNVWKMKPFKKFSFQHFF